ncbi:putative phospholipase B-like 3, partial [Octopus bimaculoides]
MRSRQAISSLALLQLVALTTVAATWTAVNSQVAYDYAYVTFEGGDYKIHEGQPNPNDKWVAKGRFNNKINETGWSYLWVETNPKGNNDSTQAYAAGLVEGNLTSPLIRLSGKNSWEGQCQNLSSTYCSKMTKFLIRNLIWMKEMIQEKAKTNPFWHM